MIVIERDGKTVVITGWRAWLLAAVAVVVTTAVLAALAFLVLGIAVSIVAFLLIVMPAVVIVALVAFPTAESVIDAGPGSQLDETLPGQFCTQRPELVHR
jgi:hypothetical protein